MIPHPFKAAKNPRAGFLDLPGGTSTRHPTCAPKLTWQHEEIRNYVYDLVLYNMDKDIQLLKLRYTADVKPTTKVPGYRGLTQICRQVREEFRPLYQAHNVYVEIDIRHAARYVTTFYDRSDYKALAKVNGSIEISLNNVSWYLGFTDQDDTEDELELLPLLQLLSLAPDLHARVVATAYISEHGVPQSVHGLNGLLRIPKMMSRRVKQDILYSIEKATLLSVCPPELTIGLTWHHMDSDCAKRSGLFGRMKLKGLVRIALLRDTSYVLH